MNEIEMEKYSEMFETYVLGIVANMFMARRLAPNEKWSAILRKEFPVTMRDLGELSYELGFEFKINLE